jgi:hypothetical protein
LKNPRGNFFLTNRTGGRVIAIPEDELLPLAYYAQGMVFNIRSEGNIVASYNHAEDLSESLAAIDIAALRRQAFDSFGRLASYFEIFCNEGRACVILITESKRRNEYFLKFRNSWGVFEMAAVEGLMVYKPEFSEPENIAKYDPLVQEFVTVPNRKTYTGVYTAEMGYKGAGERLFLMDAILSKDCFLVAGGAEHAVAVTFDGDALLLTDSEPVNISLTLRFLDKERNFTAEETFSGKEVLPVLATEDDIPLITEDGFLIELENNYFINAS